MKISAYQIFGSGCAWVGAWPTRPMPARDIAKALDVIYAHPRVDDGDNGFIGTYSVPDSVGEEVGVFTRVYCYPPCDHRRKYPPSPSRWRELATADPDRVFHPEYTE